VKTRERDQKGKFSAKNPRNILMRVTRKEKKQIEEQRIVQFFKDNAFKITSEELVRDAARSHYPPYRDGEVTDENIFGIFLGCLFERYHPMRVTLKKSLASQGFFASEELGYEILIEYSFPWEFILPYQDPPPRQYDLLDHLIWLVQMPDPHFPDIGTASLSGPTNSVITIRGVTSLNFKSQIIDSLKEFKGDSANCFIHITRTGEIQCEEVRVNKKDQLPLGLIESQILGSIQKVEYDKKTDEVTGASQELLRWIERLESQVFERYSQSFLERWNTWK
jgi:hypothetical protein